MGYDDSQKLTISELTIGQDSFSASGVLCVDGTRAPHTVNSHLSAIHLESWLLKSERDPLSRIS